MMRKIILSLTMLCLLAGPEAQAEGMLGRLKNRIAEKRQSLQSRAADVMQVGNLTVAYWLPEAFPAPLVIFSHGLAGCKTQSTFLMKALAANGYVVVAPDHHDAACGGAAKGKTGEAFTPQENLIDYSAWNDETYKDRRDDIKSLHASLKADQQWSSMIDWKRVALAGHSLGGYTALGLAGAWPSWKMEGIRSVLALSPYAGPFLGKKGDLAHVSVPVMYQTGTRDLGVKPSLVRKEGVFAQTPSAFLLEFDKTGHFSFTDLPSAAHDDIARYSVWFLDRTLKGSDKPFPEGKSLKDAQSK